MAPKKGAQGVLTMPWREGGMRPQYTGMNVLQTLACRQGQRGAVSRGLWVQLHPWCDLIRAHLDELILGVEVGYNDILAVRHTG